MSQLPPLKVLLVEDETQMASLIQTIIHNETGWDVAYAGDGQEAWQMLQVEKYDLIISDWNMPHKSGVALLQQVRQCEKTCRIPFLMVTASAERDKVLRAIEVGVSDFVVKPFTKKTLIDKIHHIIQQPLLPRSPAGVGKKQAVATPPQREDGQDTETSSRPAPPTNDQKAPDASASSHASLVKAVVRCFKNGRVDLPVLPETACRIVEMVKEPEADRAAIEKLLATDTATTAHLLRIANSPHYSRGTGDIETLKEAIVRLGLTHTLNQVFTLAYRDLFGTQAPLFADLLAKLWEHALATGVCARLLAKQAKLPNVEVCFTLGLLHDIGKVVLADILQTLSEERPGIDDDAIQYVFNTLHEELGAAVLTQWQFPEQFHQIALYHHALSRTAQVTPELRVVHLANLLVRTLGYSLHPHDGTDLSKEESSHLLGLTDEHLGNVADEVQEEVEAMRQLV